MSKIDLFTKRRLVKFITDFRQRTGELPTLRDLDDNQFPKELIKAALKEKIIDEFYLNLTNKQTIKGYKVHVDES